MANRYVLIGGGMAADAAAKAIKAADPAGAVTLVTSEGYAPYRRPHLTKALWNGGAVEKALLGTAQHGVEVLTGRVATGVDTAARRVTLEGGEELEYDQLLIATGVTARTLPGLPAGGPVVAYRTMADYATARERAGEGRRALVVGGGFVGAELAAGLRSVGTEVHIAFPEAGIGAGRFPGSLASALNERYRQRGVTVHTGVKVAGAQRAGACVRVRLTDGYEGEYDLVAVGVGVEPNVDVARSAGLLVDDGVVVDGSLRAVAPDGRPVAGVFAAGDVASFAWPGPFGRGRVEHEDAAVTMGAHAGRQMVAQARGEEPAPYEHLPFFYSDLFSDGYEAVGRLDGRLRMVEDWKRPFEEGVVYYLDGDRVVGVLLWNTWGQVDAAREVIMADQPIADESSLIGRLPA